MSEDWVTAVDENSGRIYYYNTITNDTTWDDPRNDDQNYGTSSLEWIKIFDEGSQKYYYYNELLNETSWDVPENFEEETIEKSIPSGWKEVFDESTSKYYYYNEESGDTSWDLPEELDINTDDSNVASFDNSDDLWIEHYDESSGKTYFENKETGATQWQSPYDDGLIIDTQSPNSVHKKVEYPTEDSNKSSIIRSPEALNSKKEKLNVTFNPDVKENSSPNSRKKEISANTSPKLTSMKSSPLRKSIKGFVSAPDEFTADALLLNQDDMNDGDLQDSTSLSNSPWFERNLNPTRKTFRNISDRLPSSNSNDQMNTILEIPLKNALEKINSMDSVDLISVTDTILSIDPRLFTLSDPSLSINLSTKLLSYSLEKYAENYFQYERRANQSIVNIIDQLLAWQSDPLKTSLSVFHQNNSLTDSLYCNRLIIQFITDHYHHQQHDGNKSSTSSNKIISMTMEKIIIMLLTKLRQCHDEVIDDIFCQICKYIYKNPSSESTELGWQLLLICLTAVSPSRTFLPYLTHYLLHYLTKSLHYNNKVITPIVSNIKKFLQFAWHGVIKGSKLSKRQELPTTKEIQYLLLGDNLPIRMESIDGTVFDVEIDSYTTILELHDRVYSHYGIRPDNQRYFGLFQKRCVYEFITPNSSRSSHATDHNINGGMERPLLQEEYLPVNNSTQDRVVDMLSIWNQSSVVVELDIKKEIIWSFYFKVKHYFRINFSQLDPFTLNLLYCQAVYHVKQAYYPHSIQDALLLGALLLQQQWGDYLSTHQEIVRLIHDRNQLQNYISHEAIHYSFEHDTNNLLSMTNESNQTIETQLIQVYKKLNGLKSNEIPLMYLQYVSSWKLYGATFYHVITSNGVEVTGLHGKTDMIIGILANGLIIMEKKKYKILAEYQFDDLISWGHSFDSFVTITGTKSNQLKSYYKTSQGKEMDDLLQIYSKDQLKK